MIDCGMDPERERLAMLPVKSRSDRGVARPHQRRAKAAKAMKLSVKVIQMEQRIQRLEALVTQLLRLGATGQQREDRAA